MELSDYIRLLRRNWIAILAMTLAGLAAGVGASQLMVKQYTANISMYIAVQSAESNSTVDAVQGGNAAQQKVKSYLDVVTSSRVLQPVVDDLGLDLTANGLAAHVAATAPSNSVVINVDVTDTDPERAAAIANAIGASFGRVVTDELEKPVAGGPSLVKVESLEPATTPTIPTSPRVTVNAALGLVAGALLGFLVGALRNQVDTKIRGRRDVEETTDVPVLGGISFDPDVARRPLIVRAEPRSPRAEAFRALRTNLRFVGLADGRRTFVTTSAMPAEGKSTTTANLAIALAEGGYSVALVDADLRRPRTADLMGIEGAVGLSDMLIGVVELDDVLQPWGRGGLSVLPAGSIPPNPSELLGSAAMQAVVDELSTRFDYVLIDAPPVLPVTDAAVLASFTSGVIMVTAANKSTRPQLRSALESLARVGVDVLGTVVTMLPSKGSNAYGYSTYTAYYGCDADGTGITGDGELPVAVGAREGLSAAVSNGRRSMSRAKA